MSVMQWTASTKIIKPQLDKYSKLYGLISVLGFVLCVCGFVGFALTGFLLVGRKGLEYFPFVLIPFLCFPLGMTIGMVFLTKKSKINAVLSIAAMIQTTDSMLIAKMVPLGRPESYELEYVNVIKRLIETGNLVGYEVVADAVVAKTSLQLGEDDARAQYEEFKNLCKGIVVEKPLLTECPHCGAPIENQNAKFCQYCGKLLK